MVTDYSQQQEQKNIAVLDTADGNLNDEEAVETVPLYLSTIRNTTTRLYRKQETMSQLLFEGIP